MFLSVLKERIAVLFRRGLDATILLQKLCEIRVWRNTYEAIQPHFSSDAEVSSATLLSINCGYLGCISLADTQTVIPNDQITLLITDPIQLKGQENAREVG